MVGEGRELVVELPGEMEVPRAALRVCADLRDVAQGWSVRMAADGRLSHNPNLAGAVAGWRSVGENVGYDTSVDAVHQRFMASGPHRAHIR